jgi:hypothetical protein
VNGMAYSSAIRLDEDGEEEEEEGCQQSAKKKAKTAKTTKKKRRTIVKEGGCKCGGLDHKRITSSVCPWKGLSKKEVRENYERRLDERKMSSATSEANTGEFIPVCTGVSVEWLKFSKPTFAFEIVNSPGMISSLILQERNWTE